MTKINLFSVKTSGEKFYHLARICHDHFERKSPLIVYTPKSGLNYVDELLWRYPKNGFLPHSLKNPEDLISITDDQAHLDDAQSIFNLTLEALIGTRFQVYEFEDQTSPDKFAASKKRLDAYKAKRYHLISLA